MIGCINDTKSNQSIFIMRGISQRKALSRIKQNAALERLSGNYKAPPNFQKIDVLIDKARSLGGDELEAFVSELKVEAKKKDWYELARANYKSARKDYVAERKQVAKKFGFFSSPHFVAWVKIQVLKNLAKTAGVSGLKYQWSKLMK
eukprot:NODE_294_length_11497_cov_0.618530.p6 type:complete len:147 gc:universal NODE_294_length_11497_cov_0.618530:10752-10312(-)